MGRRSEDAVGWALLALAVIAGAYLRFDALGEPSFWLDEILGHDLTAKAAAHPWWRWLTGFPGDEHGPLYYATQLAARLFGDGELAARLPAAISGVLTIPLVYLAATRAPAVAAVLLAVSPLHVYYSREARPYALLMLLTAALLLAIVRSSFPAAVAILIALLYTSAVAAPVIAAACVAALVVRQWRIAGAAAVTLMLVPLLYRATPSVSAGAGFPALDLPFFSRLLRSLTVTALDAREGGNTALLLLAFVLIGFGVRRQSRRFDSSSVAAPEHEPKRRLCRRTPNFAVIAMALMPIAFALASLRFFGHWYHVRYLAPAVLGVVILAAAGIDVLTRRIPRVGFALGLAFAIAIAAQTWNAARSEPHAKLDWRGIAQTIHDRAQPRDVVIAAEPWSEVSLRHYLDRLPPRVRLVEPGHIWMAGGAAQKAEAAWLVTAGHSENLSVRQWMCGFPLLLASEREGFRLHYSPSAQHFLRNRSMPADRRALANALGRGFTVEMSREEDLLLGEGWGNAEGEGRDAFRWATGKRASLLIPRSGQRDRTIRMRVLSFAGQQARVSLNGQSIATLPLASSWQEYSFAAPARFWRDGTNTLTFDFAHANAPAHSSDTRLLAACFDWISVDGGKRVLPNVRIASTLSMPRAHETRFGAVDPEELDLLLGRVGLDVTHRGLPVESIAAYVAATSACQDDAAFVTTAFATLVEREPNGIEYADQLGRLRAGVPRKDVTERITRSGDFRERLVAYNPRRP